MKKHVLLLALALGTSVMSFAQIKVGDNKTIINEGSLLELESTNKGLLMPRISLSTTTTWGLAGVAEKGMTVYNTNAAFTGTAAAPTLSGVVGMYFWDGYKWVGMAGTGDNWTLKGNAGTTPPTVIGTAVGTANYWGTSDAKNLSVGTAGTTRAIFDQNGSLYGGNGTYDALLNPLNSLVWGSNNKDSANYTLVAGLNNKLAPAAMHSTVTGQSNELTGSHSAVFGFFNTDSANYTLVAGRLNKLSPTALYSTVTGQTNKLTGTHSAVFGRGNNDSANYTLLAGYSNALGPTAAYSTMTGLGNSLNGSHSAVFGRGNYDSANYTLVAGYAHSLAPTAEYSIVTGADNTVTGNHSAVFGENNYNYANYTLVGGRSNILPSTAEHSIVTGAFNSVTGDGSAVFGSLNKDSANFTLVAGQTNTINGNATYGVAIGQSNTVSQSNSMALGTSNTVSHYYSMALGRNSTTTKSNQLVLGFTGGVVMSPLPNYASDAAADSDVTLPSGALYKTTLGGRAVFQKP